MSMWEGCTVQCRDSNTVSFLCQETRRHFLPKASIVHRHHRGRVEAEPTAKQRSSSVGRAGVVAIDLFDAVEREMLPRLAHFNSHDLPLVSHPLDSPSYLPAHPCIKSRNEWRQACESLHLSIHSITCIGTDAC